MNVLDILDRIDWNFPRAGTEARSVHSVHWFPGNFIPQIPMALVETLSEPGDLVLDPFGGSGTTAIAAATCGRKAIVSDRLSVCVLIAQAKVDIQARGLERKLRSDLVAALTWRHQCRSDSFG